MTTPLPTRQALNGFTLIELSIALVIIGLLVGSILTGTELIYAARLRSMGTELSKMQTAVTAFRVKYSCLPGDCINGESFFGTNSSSCPTAGGSTGTCNGNGDGSINSWWVNGNVEYYFTWQQLSMAGLIPWQSTNAYVTGGTGGAAISIGKNVPALSWNSNFGYLIFSLSTISGHNIPANVVPFVGIQIGALSGTNHDFLWGTALTAPQSYDLDRKFDDGLGLSGLLEGSDQPAGETVGSNQNPNTTCLSGTTYSTATATGCILYYELKNQ